ncbi:hypothetical cytosolic protein [Syntrophus aciditrophicus SB]|uniref:Hypothetical cytosolic protein n=1 Tax=Syntrophus aciditrophicus (strain SB) TaxID=56780 RepID=Q2LPM3_SYNAS|nr:hypothetical cytosolic protein [Syntrophus aciditrophicus SB]
MDLGFLTWRNVPFPPVSEKISWIFYIRISLERTRHMRNGNMAEGIPHNKGACLQDFSTLESRRREIVYENVNRL